MKKLSVFALAALVLVAFTAPAGAVEHSLKGNWWTKAQLMDNFEVTETNTPVFDEDGNIVGTENNSQYRSEVRARSRVTWTAKFSDDFKFVTQFEIGETVWGQEKSAAGKGYGALGADGVDVEIKHTYADFNLGLHNFRVGVSGQWMGKGFIFDKDAANITWIGKFSDMVTVAAAWTRVLEGGVGKDDATLEKNNDKDEDYLFFTPTLGLGEGMTLEFPIAYFFTDSLERDAGVWWFGVQWDHTISNLSYSANFYFNAGDDNDEDKKGWALNGSVGYDLGEMDIHGSFTYASGDDTPGDGEDDAFYSPHGFVGFSEIMGEGTFWTDTPNSANAYYPTPSNIFWVGGGIGYKPMDKLKLGADLWWAKLAEENEFGEDGLGLELDLSADYAIMDGLNLLVIGGYLWADDGISPTGNAEDDPWELGAQLSLSF